MEEVLDALAGIASGFDAAVIILTSDHVNSAAALHVMLADTATYLLLVFMEAIAEAEETPSAFYRVVALLRRGSR